ncbi:putative Sigma factor sigb regulation protein rsbq [Quillaja saponaria]|uniref:Sigma factor sigb regulation protein rsbq n=1 Tax=Quillaja saponaria TaxID=32244 RepID=A0AAD7VD55_QUISA|nr:putative Sigma factor sigb regulation protein rsbq [Quillaja saponaria]
MGTLCDYGGGIVNTLNTNVYGNGTHGFGTDQTVWQYLIPYLACYFKVVVFDLAFSPNIKAEVYDPKKYANLDAYAQDLVCLLDQLNLNKTIYMGHSMSAMIGCLAATRRSELFEHLVLVSGSPRYLNAKGYDGGFQKSELETIFQTIHQNFSSWVQNFAPKAVDINNTVAIALFEQSLRRMEPDVALSVAKTVFLSDLRWVLPQVIVPCTIIQSRKDYIVPKSIAFYMKRRIPARPRVQILKTVRSFSSANSLYFTIESSERDPNVVCKVLV